MPLPHRNGWQHRPRVSSAINPGYSAYTFNVNVSVAKGEEGPLVDRSS